MKEIYKTPKAEIVMFDEKTDIIRTSGIMPETLFDDKKGVDIGTTSYTNLID